jgi:hypothetical protein
VDNDIEWIHIPSVKKWTHTASRLADSDTRASTGGAGTKPLLGSGNTVQCQVTTWELLRMGAH